MHNEYLQIKRCDSSDFFRTLGGERESGYRRNKIGHELVTIEEE